MKEPKKGASWLRWPWNLLLYILLLVVLRIWAVPVIALIMSWQKKHQPEGPAEGYCLQRTRRRLAWLVWAVLFLVAGLACGAVFITQLQADHSAWKTEDYVTLVVAGIVAVGGTGIGLYEGYTDLRDALVPEKSRLAQSIRSQLPYPEEAPNVRELFAMVDKDIRENGQWFDRVAVGKEWVLGDDASSIARIRVVFGRDEIQHHHSGKRTTTNRVIELYILDDRRQVQVTSLRDPNELPAVMDCLRLRAPEALFRPYSEYADYCGKSDDEWAQLLLEYQRRKTSREMRAATTPQAPATPIPAAGTVPPPPPRPEPRPTREPPQPHLTLISREGVRQNHTAFTGEDLQVAAEGLVDGSYQSVTVLLPGGYRWFHAEAGDQLDGRYLVRASRPDPDKLRFFSTRCSHRQAAAFLLEFAQGTLRPEKPDWKDYTREVEKV